MNKFFKKVTLISFLLIVFIFQTLPISAPSKIIGLDKIVHFFIYFFLTFLFWWNDFSLRKAIIYSIFYGILMELVQIPIPQRDVSFFDFLANCLGTFTFLLIKFLNKKY
jgi:VanZ family protein